jgi:hypothetical protein
MGQISASLARAFLVMRMWQNVDYGMVDPGDISIYSFIIESLILIVRDATEG